MVREAIDGIPEKNVPRVLWAGAGFLFLMVCQSGLRYVWRMYLMGTSHRIARGLRLDLYNHLQNLPLARYQTIRTGDLMSRATNDIQAIREAAEHAPSGRARCKHCEDTIEKASLRVVLGREISFGNQVRVSPINVHPRCVAAELAAEDCGTEVDGFEEALRLNSSGLGEAEMKALMEAIGELI